MYFIDTVYRTIVDTSFMLHEIAEHISVASLLLEDKKLLDEIQHVADICSDCIENGGKIILFGNGGSAADSQHIAAEFVSRLNFDRPTMAAIALTTDTSILTAIGNDYGFQHLFSRQLKAIGNKGDVAFGITTSGNSQNVLSAVNAAKILGITTVGLTGKNSGQIDSLVDYLIDVPTKSTARIQELHILLGHIICGIVEKRLFGNF